MVPTIALIGLLGTTPAPPTADLLIENARIWSDGLPGFAECAAVNNGRFVYVGPFDPNLITPHTERIDAEGRVVIPGLIDSHIHMLGGGTQLARLNLREATSKEDFIRCIKEWAERLDVGGWVLGGRWSVESWTTPEPPTKEWVDPFTRDRPVFLSRMDGHSALVNSAAMRIAGITKDGPPDPDGGVIDRDPLTGEPTGILREAAMELVSQHIPKPSVADKVQALKLAMQEAIRHGITAVSDIPDLEDLPAYELLAESDLTIRFFLYPTADDWEVAAERAKGFPAKPRWIEICGFKAYMDGSLGSRTAYMRQPFRNNEPGRESWRGLLREGVEDGRISGNLATAARLGYQPIVHAIGDKANHLLVNLYEQMLPNVRAARCRSEHSQHLLPEDITRFGALGVIASMQPYHKSDDGRYAESYIGPERSRSSYAFKSLLDAGAVVAFGSDWPVVSINPFLGIETAVTGRIMDGTTWQTQENITVAEALRCYTSRAAYSVFAEDELGRIAPGYRADFVILDHSPFDPHVEWSLITPVAVYIEGRNVYTPP